MHGVWGYGVDRDLKSGRIYEPLFFCLFHQGVYWNLIVSICAANMIVSILVHILVIHSCKSYQLN